MQNVLKHFKKGQKFRAGILKRLIMIEVGASENLISECMRMMLDFGLIREVDNMVFEVVGEQTKAELEKEVDGLLNFNYNSPDEKEVINHEKI